MTKRKERHQGAPKHDGSPNPPSQLASSLGEEAGDEHQVQYYGPNASGAVAN